MEGWHMMPPTPPGDRAGSSASLMSSGSSGVDSSDRLPPLNIPTQVAPAPAQGRGVAPPPPRGPPPKGPEPSLPTGRKVSSFRQQRRISLEPIAPINAPPLPGNKPGLSSSMKQPAKAAFQRFNTTPIISDREQFPPERSATHGHAVQPPPQRLQLPISKGVSFGLGLGGVAAFNTPKEPSEPRSSSPFEARRASVPSEKAGEPTPTPPSQDQGSEFSPKVLSDPSKLDSSPEDLKGVLSSSTDEQTPDMPPPQSTADLAAGLHHHHESAAALCAAAADGDVDVLEALLDSGLPAGQGDYDRRTALHLASEEGHLECVQLLVEHGADVNCCDRWGTTPLKGAVHNLHNEVANYLRDRGAKAGTGNLHLTKNKRQCRKFFEKVLNFANIPADSNAVPLLAIGAYLVVNYGMDIENHSVLVEELEGIARRPKEVKTQYDREIREWINAGTKFVDKCADLGGGPATFGTPEPRATAKRASERPRTAERPRSAEAPLHSPRECYDDTEVASDIVECLGSPATVWSEAPKQVPFTHPMLKMHRGIPKNQVRFLVKKFGKGVTSYELLMKAALGNDVPDDDGSPHQIPKQARKSVRQRICVATVPAPFLQKVVLGKLQVNNWRGFIDSVLDIAASVLHGPNSGSLAESIPILKNQDPNVFSVAVTTVDGQQVEIGDTNQFSMQSAGMPFLYASAVEDYGESRVHSFVGQEAIGRSVGQEEFGLTEAGKPFNAVCNAGALVTASLYHPEESVQDRIVRYVGVVRKLSAGKPSVNEEVYASEQDTSYRNHSLASFLMAERCFSPSCKSIKQYQDHVAFYHRTCAVQNSALGVSAQAATLANYGVNPLTGEKVYSFNTIKLTLQLAYSCGMRNSAGEWACTVGIPAKSGITGVIWLCVPGVLGLCVRSPKLDVNGNSVRGVEFSRRFAERFQWGVMDLLYKARDAGTEA
eukprot:Hpha_TRINITY_DN14464_c0_g1::TRINITY_DN14464_c0_g1_i1::g.157384::m.157384/K01425/glsA, GLS; glutaminase